MVVGDEIALPSAKEFPISPSAGDIVYFNGTSWVKLAKPTGNKWLKGGTTPSYTIPDNLAVTSQAQGDILIFDGSNWIRLAKGTAAKVLKMNSGATAPEWGN